MPYFPRFGLQEEGKVPLLKPGDCEEAGPLTRAGESPSEGFGCIRMPSFLDGQGPDIMATQELADPFSVEGGRSKNSPSA